MFNYDDELVFINYESDFNSETDLTFMGEDHLYSDEWVFNEDLVERIYSRAGEWASQFGFELEVLFDKGRMKQKINAIISVTGDDEIMTVDSVLLIVLHLAVSELCSEITISRKDTGISRRKGNYTEGWILLCPASEADFTSVVLRHRNDGVPLVFDITKLKATSAVRKQSSLEMDLESKYELLNKAAGWVDRDWFTYDYAQQSLIFATCIFDFSNARLFPYLYKSEGGCGGQPPWRNVLTAVCMLKYFNRGKSTKSVLALMDECCRINNLTMKPSEALYVNASHYAQMGNEKLSKISNAKRYLKSFDKTLRMEILESCKGTDSLPQELLEKSVIVEVEDKLLGSAIAELRKNGLVMTELDVQLKQIGTMKFSDLLKDENMGLVRMEREKQKALAKKNAMAQLAKFSATDPTLRNIESMAITIMSSYYRVRMDVSDITSLTYAGLLRVFKTSDVEEFFRRNSYGLSDEIITGLSTLRNQNMNLKLNQAKEDLDYQIEWIESGTLDELFDGEIPPSIGTDDARIARKIKSAISVLKPEETFVFVVITDDQRLIGSLNRLYGTPLISVVRCPIMDYIRDCNNTISVSKVSTYNFLQGKETRFPTIERTIRMNTSWITTRLIGYKILFDFPNLNRSLMGIKRISRREIGRVSGGYLRRTTAQRTSYQSMMWNDFSQLRDFNRTVLTYTV